MTDFERVPADLSELVSWCVSIEPEKRPYRATNPDIPASPTSPVSWCGFVQAWQCCEDGNADWAGVCLTEDDGICVVDLDHCIDENGEPSELAWECMDRWAGAYCEVSKSGSGLHFFFKGTLPRSVVGEYIEAYDRGRYVVVTGRSTRNPCEPLSELDDTDYEWMAERAGKAPRKPHSGISTVGEGADCNAQIIWDGLIPSIPRTDAMRHATLVSFAALLKNAGWSDARIEEAVVRANRQSCIPPLDDSEARRIAKWAQQKT